MTGLKFVCDLKNKKEGEEKWEKYRSSGARSEAYITVKKIYAEQVVGVLMQVEIQLAGFSWTPDTD